jgi:hypothetical protein
MLNHSGSMRTSVAKVNVRTDQSSPHRNLPRPRRARGLVEPARKSSSAAKRSSPSGAWPDLARPVDPEEVDQESGGGVQTRRARRASDTPAVSESAIDWTCPPRISVSCLASARRPSTTEHGAARPRNAARQVGCRAGMAAQAGWLLTRRWGGQAREDSVAASGPLCSINPLARSDRGLDTPGPASRASARLSFSMSSD